MPGAQINARHNEFCIESHITEYKKLNMLKLKKIFNLLPLARCHRSQTLLSSTGTSTACKVRGLSLDPGLSAPQPAAQPYWPRKSEPRSGRQMGAGIRVVRHEFWVLRISFMVLIISYPLSADPIVILHTLAFYSLKEMVNI